MIKEKVGKLKTQGNNASYPHLTHTSGGGVKTTLENYLQLSNKAKHHAHSDTIILSLMGILKRKKKCMFSKGVY